jgi:hypothetical protein
MAPVVLGTLLVWLLMFVVGFALQCCHIRGRTRAAHRLSTAE